MSAILLFCVCAGASAQEKPKTPEELEKEFYARVEEMVDKYTTSLNLEDWQAFYVDSILVHNLKAKEAELKMLREARVSNSELFIKAEDRWEEATYMAFSKIFNEEQWIKYNKRGAGKEKKSRDKRMNK